MTDEEIQAIEREYQDDLQRAADTRDAKIRRARAEGRKQVDIVKLTGYSRETIRQTLNPEARAAVRKAAADRRAAARNAR